MAFGEKSRPGVASDIYMLTASVFLVSTVFGSTQLLQITKFRIFENYCISNFLTNAAIS